MKQATAIKSIFHETLKRIKLPEGGKASDADMGNAFSPGLMQQIRTAAAEGDPLPGITRILPLSGHSNDLVKLFFEDGRCLMVKRSQYDWAASRFLSARRSSELIRERNLAVVPEYLNLPVRTDGMPVLAYWHIDLPTLDDLWPHLPEEERPQVLRSLGQLLSRIHGIPVDRHGPLDRSGNGSRSSARYFGEDLRERLKPALWGNWSEAIPLLNQLEKRAGDLPCEKSGAVLVHNDIHLGNILCDEIDGEIRCVGLLDLEAAGGGRPESDLASASVLHSPLFAEEGKGDWSERFDEYVMEGYGRETDERALHFFRAWHLLNLGFFSALNGDEWHAGQVADRTHRLLECA